MPDKLPDMTPVISSNVHSVGHDGQHLYVRFKGKDGAAGPLYRYPNAHHLHDGFLTTDSPGRMFADRVKRFYKGEKIG